MGNLNCSNLTIDTQNEIKSADDNRKNTYISKNHILKISFPIRNTKKSKTSSPKSHLSLKEKNFVFSDNNKNKEESKKDKTNFRRSFTPRRRKHLKISPDINTSNKKEESKNFKNYKNKEKETKDNEDNDMNKKGVILKKGKSSPLEVICEQIEDEKKVLDTTRTFKNKEKDKNINDKNNSNLLNNNKNSEKTQKDLVFNDRNESNNNQNILLNSSDYYSDKSEHTDKEINENNNENDSIIKKKEIGLFFNHTGSSKGEEDCKQDYNNEIMINDNLGYNNNDIINDNDNDNNYIEDKYFKKKILKEKYKNLYKKKYYRNKYNKELNWHHIKIDNFLLTKDDKDILLQGELLVFNNIKEINSTLQSKYLRFLTLTKIEINIYRSKEKYIYYKSPLINISLFNISKCDLVNKNDIKNKKYSNLSSLLLKYSFFIQFTSVRSMITFEQNKKYRPSNPFIRATFHRPKSLNKFSNKPKDIELIPLIPDINIKCKKNYNNDDLNKINNGKNNDAIDKIQYIIISSDNCELILNLVAIINYLRK